MEILQTGPAETTGYMIAGFAVIFGLMLIYIVSLSVRTQKVKNELDNLREINKLE